MAPWDYTGRNVLVVGGTSGINRGIAEAFAAAGARVAVASRSQEKVDDTIAALQALGAESMGFCADVRDAEVVRLGVQSVHESWGELDVVVSGAAGNFPAMATGMSVNAFKSVVDIDLLGSFHVAQAVYPFLRKPGGSLIHISAPQAHIAMPGQSHVCAAKAGVDMLTRTLALEWGAEGIRVNSVLPGPIDGTEGMQRLAPKEHHRQAVAQSVPLGRLGQPEDIARACLFLASEQAAYIAGVVLPVDGGWSLGGAAATGAALGAMLNSNSPKSKEK
ncbi:SDR family oxidoreductase [Marinimicrobium sp. ABcell2]|uniref:SDR family oxidoreductase n=1 Tax=Marinimicrobium sp. ABcell2 TaxID=3069751 RepID=UPI0027B4E6E1|nr:SDR family oxidoreductase [Marinimicrobium sp. ABcell2]MDQ2078445.1 SDR family oxidoreductase [Marinimicrobium sp. ABcell2]